MDDDDKLRKVSLADRLAFGFVTINELCALKCCGKTQVYTDLTHKSVIKTTLA